MKKKKVRQNIIPYESDKFEIGFEGNNTEGYAHIVGENVYADNYQIVSNLINDGYLVHATPTEFDEFNPEFIRGGMRAHEGYGFYFTDMQYKPLEYGNILWVVKKDDFNFLDSSTPISIDMFGEKYKIELHKLNDRLDNVRTNREYDYISSEIERLEDEYNKLGGDNFFDYIDIAIEQDNARTIAQLESRIRNSKYTVPKLTELYVSWGYDGYITDRIYTIFNFDKLKKLSKKIDLNNMNNLNEALNLSSFKVQDKLNPNFWKNEKLDSRVRLKLLDIADDFTDFLNVDWVKPEDITMTGSLANYNWSKEYSDIDLHIIIDYKKVDDRIEFVREYFKSKKELWNQEHENLKIFGFPVELYVQDKNEKHNSSGVYSLEKNEWIEKPQKKEPTKSNLRKAEQNAESWIEKIDKIMNRYYPDATDSEKENILNKLDSTFNDIKNSRRKSFSNGKDEMNKDNLTFKMLRRNGYLDKIHNKKVEIYDDLMSIDENILSNIIKENISKYIINEISIIDKYNKEKEKNNYINKGIDFDTFEELCNIDPTTKPNKVGKYCNWLIAKYNPNTNFNELKRCLEWFADGVKRNILSRYNIPSDINSFKTYEELINTMNNLNDNNDDLDISSSEYNNRNKLEGQFEVLGSTSFYDIIVPKTFDAERYFGSNTEWCTVANKNYFLDYMEQGQLYILYPKNGDSEYKMQFHFESVSFADKYDNVLGDPIDCIKSVIEDKNIYNELISLCKKVFAKNVKYMKYFSTFEEVLESILIELENGTNPRNLFDKVDDFREGYAIVCLKGKWNWINTEGELLNPNQWFDYVFNFQEGYAVVEIRGKGWNYINTDGNFLRDDLWFKDAYSFKEGYAVVQLNGKWNWINTEGEFFSPNQWFNGTGIFQNGVALVKLKNKYNFIKTDGNFICDDIWFDMIWGFQDGIAKVEIESKGYNFINTEGKILCPDIWFDRVLSFNNNVGIVELNSKGCNLINTEGELLSPNQWFDNIRKTENLYRVFLRDKGFNYINSNGEYVSDEWFAEAGLLRRGRTEVKLFNGEEFRLVIHPHNENKVILRKRMDENKKYNNKILTENINNRKLYHQTVADINVIKSIIENGLIPNDNGEVYGIWFNKKPFYNDYERFMVSLPETEENLEKYDFSKFFDGDLKIARKQIPFNALTVENIPFASINGEFCFYSNMFNEKFRNSKFVQKYENLATYIAEKTKKDNILIYTDLFEMFVESGTSYIFSKYPHIKTDILLK